VEGTVQAEPRIYFLLAEMVLYKGTSTIKNLDTTTTSYAHNNPKKAKHEGPMTTTQRLPRDDLQIHPFDYLLPNDESRWERAYNAPTYDETHKISSMTCTEQTHVFPNQLFNGWKVTYHFLDHCYCGLAWARPNRLLIIHDFRGDAFGIELS